MKKNTFILAALALTAASCSETEIVNSDTQDVKESINFSAYTSRLTKAAQTDVTTANLSAFNVTAIGNDAIYFNDLTFTKGTAVWESSTEYVWPNYPLDFYAYNVPVNANEMDKTDFGTYITLDENRNIKVAPAKELANQEDLVVAKALGQTSASAGMNEHHAVNLSFKHYLTQIVVKAMNSNTEDYNVDVTDVAIRNIAGKGVYYFSTDKMTAESGNVADYVSTFPTKRLTELEHEVMTEDGNGKWYQVPQTITPWVQSTDIKNASKGSYLALKVKITSTTNGTPIYPITSGGGDEYAWMAVPVPSVVNGDNVYDYVQGKKYTIILNFFSDGTGAGFVDPEYPGDLDGDGDTEDDKGQPIGVNVIKFNASVDEWDTENTTITINL